MQKIKKTPLILTEYRYAFIKNGSIPEFSYIHSVFPKLDYTKIPVLLTHKEEGGESYLLEEVEKIKKYRYIYTIVEAETEEEAMLLTLSNIHYKIWFNGVYVGANVCYDLFAFFLRPKKGRNLLVFEISPDNVWKYDFTNQIVLRWAEEQRSESFLSDSCIEFFKRAQLFHSPDARGGKLSMICLPRSFSFVKRIVLDLINDFGETVLKQKILPGKEYFFSTEELLTMSPKTKRVQLSVELFFKDGTSAKRNQYSLLQNFVEEAPKLAFRWKTLECHADPYTFALMEDQYKKLLSEPLQNTPDEAVSLLRIKRLLDDLEQGEPPFYRKQNSTHISYWSPIDRTYRRIGICVPEHLVEKPGLLIFCNFSKNGIGDRASALLTHRSDVIIADLYTAGVSIGNPLGESLLLEGLDEIKKIYSIDEQRVYLYGYCANGYTVWSFARNFPHKVAGFSCTESLPTPVGLENLNNIRSTTYYCKAAKSPILHKIATMPHHKIIRIRNTCHAFMLFYLYKGQSYRFLDDSLQEYPKIIRFYTQRIRHNRSFWITVNNIRKGKAFARVVAEILDPKNIRIRLTNCDDITLDVPPQMEPSFCVNLNGTSIQAEAGHKQTLRFVKNPSWRPSEETHFCPSRKGTGLLDVYYGPMRIVREHTEVAEKIAQRFSQPEVMTFDPKLLVQYPIYTQDNFPHEEKIAHLILINIKTVCGTTIDFPIETDQDGYEYQGKRFSGDYCVFQVIPNPFNPQSSIMQVKSNCLEKFATNLFLRKIILPSMLTGVSPYWNSEGLILTDDRIITIKEW